MLDVEFILVVDDIEYQHRLLSRPKAEALLNSVHEPRAFNSSRRIVIYKQCMADVKNLASRKILVHRRHLTFAIDNDALIATFSEGREPWRDWIVISH
jgi:hypothetical protein